jgi:cytochrome c5
MASSSHLGPREKGKISVKVDVKGKTGNIQKTIQVHTNDPANPVTNLFVIMQVKDSLHLSKHSAKEIFSGQCRACHVEKGSGKKSAELFRADCSMCHAAGKSASSISQMGRRPKGYLKNVITNGVESSSMPGWALKK